MTFGIIFYNYVYADRYTCLEKRQQAELGFGHVFGLWRLGRHPCQPGGFRMALRRFGASWAAAKQAQHKDRHARIGDPGAGDSNKPRFPHCPSSNADRPHDKDEDIMLPRVNMVRTDETDYLLFSTQDAISRTIHSNGYWAKLLIDIGWTFCSGLEAPLVLDIGANLGAYSIPLAQKLAPSGGVVYAYEPQRIIYYQLCGNIFLNRMDNIHAFNCAVGSAPEKVDIPDLDYKDTQNIGGFTLSEIGKLNNLQIKPVGGNNKVDLITLDEAELPKCPSLIKIDVEGFELEVIKGAKNLIAKSAFPPILLEAWTEDWFAEQRKALLDQLQDYGYGYFLIGDEVIAQHPAHPRQFTFSVDSNSALQMIRTK
jgi:FkbM family methyltransferase